MDLAFNEWLKNHQKLYGEKSTEFQAAAKLAWNACEIASREHIKESPANSAAVALLRETMSIDLKPEQVFDLQDRVEKFLESQPPCPDGSVNSGYTKCLCGFKSSALRKGFDMVVNQQCPIHGNKI